MLIVLFTYLWYLFEHSLEPGVVLMSLTGSILKC